MNKYLQKAVELYETWKAKWESLNRKGKLIVAGLVIISIVVISEVM
tara:strand:- start:4995 stop:5132 length:138 start_codon:yes stop_codon:yes gene_type:complete